MTTANLLYEKWRDDFVISKRDAPTFNGLPCSRLVEFKQHNDAYGENEWGQIRLHVSKLDNCIVLQLRGLQRLNEDDEKRNIIATTYLGLSDLKEIVRLAEEAIQQQPSH